MKSRFDGSQQAFFALVKAGLWEQEVLLSTFDEIDYYEIMNLAEEQAVVGLVTAGLEHIDVRGQKEDVRCRPSQEMMLQFVGETLQIEQQNKDMNVYLAELVETLRKEDVYAILIKGQGIAQCYEKPLWRAAGDIDYLMDEENYTKAKELLLPKAQYVEKDYDFFKHIGISLDGWMVELHGTLHGRLSARIDKTLDLIQEQMLKDRNVRIWHNDDADIYLPNPDADVIFVFAHILHHFFFEGVGLRQICDWCRLLWTYKKEIDVDLLESRLRIMRLITEWMAFSAYAVEWLGMPTEAMPLYAQSTRWTKKAKRINSFVLKVGNFGHNQKHSTSYRFSLIWKLESLLIRLGSLKLQFRIFPKDSILFFIQVFKSALKAAYERNNKDIKLYG